jgi:RHS repeat-associated protein
LSAPPKELYPENTCERQNDPWGNQLPSSTSQGTFACAYGFVGSLGVRTDFTTGLVHMRHRWYDPGLARFVSRDPLGQAAAVNLYLYADNRPTMVVDPYGLQPGIVESATQTALGAAQIGVGLGLEATDVVVPGPGAVTGGVMIRNGVINVVGGVVKIGVGVGTASVGAGMTADPRATNSTATSTTWGPPPGGDISQSISKEERGSGIVIVPHHKNFPYIRREMRRQPMSIGAPPDKNKCWELFLQCLAKIRRACDSKLENNNPGSLATGCERTRAECEKSVASKQPYFPQTPYWPGAR